MEHETSSSQREDNLRLRLQEKYDQRYVGKEGEWPLIKLLVFGCAGLMLTSVIVAVLAFVIHSAP